MKAKLSCEEQLINNSIAIGPHETTQK